MKYQSNNAEMIVDMEATEEKPFFPLEWVASAIRAARNIALQHEHIERVQAERLAAIRPVPRLGRRG